MSTLTTSNTCETSVILYHSHLHRAYKVSFLTEKTCLLRSQNVICLWPEHSSPDILPNCGSYLPTIVGECILVASLNGKWSKKCLVLSVLDDFVTDGSSSADYGLSPSQIGSSSLAGCIMVYVVWCDVKEMKRFHLLVDKEKKKWM